MDAFLPGVGDWKNVWLMRDLWHFHFYGEVPLALVEGRERTYFEHFWNDFAADATHSVPEADRRIYARGLRPAGRACGPASSTSRPSSRTREDFAGLRARRKLHDADAGADGREGVGPVPHRAGQPGGDQRARRGREGLGPLADGGGARAGHSGAGRVSQRSGAMRGAAVSSRTALFAVGSRPRRAPRRPRRGTRPRSSG